MLPECVLFEYIKKLKHPLKEIRERSLQLLLTKFRLGWQLNDELIESRELVQNLLNWFSDPCPSFQNEALELFLLFIKTKSGTYIVKEIGIESLITKISQFRHKIDKTCLNIYGDLLETLCFLKSLDSEENFNIPSLVLQNSNSSNNENICNSQKYNMNDVYLSLKTSSLNENGIQNRNTEVANGVKVLLLPWVQLCASDSKTYFLIEDALKLLKSTRRCCRFIRDVFLRDFPVEIFLNRPTIIQNLLSLADGGHPAEPLNVLLCITRKICLRILQISSEELYQQKDNQLIESSSNEEINVELEEIALNLDNPVMYEEDNIAVLRQLPVPIYALDTMNSVLTLMTKNVINVEPNDKTCLSIKELVICLSLLDRLVQLLLLCITENFWTMDHRQTTHRDIAHRSCMAMRILGDLIGKIRKCYLEQPKNRYYRVAYIRLIKIAIRLIIWSKESPLPPSSLAIALQTAQLDPALDLYYPEISNNIKFALDSTRISIDQEFKSKFRELTKLCSSAENAIFFMKNLKSCRDTKKVLHHIKKSLPVLDFHQNVAFVNDVSEILLNEMKNDDTDWVLARNIALALMSHNLEWVKLKFYELLNNKVKSVFVCEDGEQLDNEKCLMLLCDVGVLTEICCHGLSSQNKKVEQIAAEIMTFLLRGRMVVSGAWWGRLLASLLPVAPLLQAYAAHDTSLGMAICKSLDSEIAACMGFPTCEIVSGLVRLLFVRCPTVQLDAAHSLCAHLDDERYLPPKETLRADILLNALRRNDPQDFNIVPASTNTNKSQATGIVQILDVLKQDLALDPDSSVYIPRSSVQPTLEPSLRRSTLQQLSVMMRHQELHNTFLEADGINVIVAILRMSLMMEDFLAFPECAISCVSVINSICFNSRHSLAKINDLSSLLLRVILVFPANEPAVLMSAQVLSITVWCGFVLQELDDQRNRVPALPKCVTDRVALPFQCNSYWASSSNALHSSLEWLQSDDDFRSALRIHWWLYWHEGRIMLPSDQNHNSDHGGTVAAPTSSELMALQSTCVVNLCSYALLLLQNATSHTDVLEALNLLEGYTFLVSSSSPKCKTQLKSDLPWQYVRRFLGPPPASLRDTQLLTALLSFCLAYIRNVPYECGFDWVMSLIIGEDTTLISLLSKDQFYPQQSSHDNLEITQMKTNIVKLLRHCIITLDEEVFYSRKLESLLKILLACLDKVDLKNFHQLGYLNELTLCVRHTVNSRHCKLSEDTLIISMKVVLKVLTSSSTVSGRKGQACRLDTLLSLLALLRLANEQNIPVQRWSDTWDSNAFQCLIQSDNILRAAATHIMAILAQKAIMLPQLLHVTNEDSLMKYAMKMFADVMESNVVRTASAGLITIITSRLSPNTDILENDVLGNLEEFNFIENCLQIFIDFTSKNQCTPSFEPNIPLSLLERRSELEVRALKCDDVRITPSVGYKCAKVSPSPALIVATSDIVHNVCTMAKTAQSWNERGLFRLMFKCAFWSGNTSNETHKVRASVCRALFVASSYKSVRATLANTTDCFHSLLLALTPLDEDECSAETLQSRSQGLLLLGSLLTERQANDTLWEKIRTEPEPFFVLLIQFMESQNFELEQAALYSLTQMTQSNVSRKQLDHSKEKSVNDLLDNIKSPFIDVKSERFCAGDDGQNNDYCQPEYLIEELSKVVINLFTSISLTDNITQSSEDERWIRISCCLSSLLSLSPRARLYGVHRNLPTTLLSILQIVRDQLSLQGKPVDVIRNANHSPVLRILYWVLTTIDASMLNCSPAKETYAEDNIAASLNRLWPWCMMTEQLRLATMHLLHTFVNQCPKAWSSICQCVGGRSLAGELCALVCREVSLQSASHSTTLLMLLLSTLRRSAGHQQTAHLLLKSDALTALIKLMSRPSMSSRESPLVRAVCALCEALARRTEGAARVSAAATTAASRVRLLPAIAHAAHWHPTTFLHDGDLLELLSGTLLTGDTSEMIHASRAVWALAANNHKAKLLLRSAGIQNSVRAALQRVHRCAKDDGTQKLVQLLEYTNTVLQT